MWTRPEQSIPADVIPPHSYGVPSSVRACSTGSDATARSQSASTSPPRSSRRIQPGPVAAFLEHAKPLPAQRLRHLLCILGRLGAERRELAYERMFA
jgi:hypothetical protein